MHNHIVKQVSFTLIGFILVFAILAFAAHTSNQGIKENYQSLEHLVRQNNAITSHMTVMSEAIRERMLIVYDILQTEDLFDMDELVSDYRQKARDFIKARESLYNLELTPQQRSQLDKQKDILADAQEDLNRTVDNALSGTVEKSTGLVTNVRKKNLSVLNDLQAMRELQEKVSEEALQKADIQYKDSIKRVTTLGSIAIILCVLVVIFIARLLVTQGSALTKALKKLEEINTSLEERVETRTRELMNSREDNLRMSTELDISRQLQEVILPGENELAAISQLDIAAYMEPADEVGGDYYDVLQQGEKVVFAIGDVTGHGLESGMVMMMTQSAIRALSYKNETSLQEMLITTNQMVHGNVQRMDCEKNLSLSLLKYSPESATEEKNETDVSGTLTICGQHEYVIVVRSDGTLEKIDTDNLGFPIGLIDDVSEFISELSIDLRENDLVVLYTDGITEAANEKEHLYGLPRLTRVITDNHTNSASEIKQSIIKDVKSHIGEHIIYDDLTLIVFKQK